MSASLLREAAALMRERAEATTPGPWRWEADYLDTVTGEGGDPYVTSYMGHVADVETGDEAEHIASWHPAVALAVADWLDTVAERLIDSANTGAILGGTDYEAALAVARAYLGETS